MSDRLHTSGSLPDSGKFSYASGSKTEIIQTVNSLRTKSMKDPSVGLAER